MSDSVNAIEFEVNEIHTATHRITRDQLSDDEWEHLKTLSGEERVAYLEGLCIDSALVDDTLEYSRLMEGSMRDVIFTRVPALS